LFSTVFLFSFAMIVFFVWRNTPGLLFLWII